MRRPPAPPIPIPQLTDRGQVALDGVVQHTIQLVSNGSLGAGLPCHVRGLLPLREVVRMVRPNSAALMHPYEPLTTVACRRWLLGLLVRNCLPYECLDQVL